MAAKIKKGDKVVILAGRDKGRTGEVIKVMPDENRALVRGLNMVRRHQRQTANQEGGIISKEAPLDLSNLAIADPKGTVIGGHLCTGSLVRTTAELVIGLLPEWTFHRELDPATGCAELQIIARSAEVGEGS
jgi:large subunit ribosomal protein L24